MAMLPEEQRTVILRIGLEGIPWEMPARVLGVQWALFTRTSQGPETAALADGHGGEMVTIDLFRAA